MQDYRKARWICAPEAMWRIYGFVRYKQMPPVHRLAVHLEDCQHLMFNLKDKTDEQRTNILARSRSEYSFKVN